MTDRIGGVVVMMKGRRQVGNYCEVEHAGSDGFRSVLV